MTTYNAAELEFYQLQILRAQGNASRRAVSLVKKWLAVHPQWEAADLRNECIRIAQSVVGEYGEYAASLACDLYDACMTGAGFPAAEMWEGDSNRQVEKAVRYQLSKALEGDMDGFVDAIKEMTSNYVRKAVNETMRQNVERDRTNVLPGGIGGGMDFPSKYAPKAHRRQVRHSRALEYGDVAYARVPTGARTCTYCMMLASRGFAYHKESTAEAGDHRNCDCLIVPGRKGMDSIEGIDQQAQYDCWREMESLDAYAAAHPDEMDAAEVERRKQEIVSRYDGLTLSDEPGEVRKHVANSGGPDAWYEARARMGRYYDADANAMA